MRYYAQLNESGVCVAVTGAADVIIAENMVELEELNASLLGHTYDAGTGEFTPPAPLPDPCEWLIDIGPFFDRFGAAKMAVLVSANATAQALVKDLQVRKWIDLQRADVAAGIDALIALAIPGVTSGLKTTILTTPVSAEENMALRRVYFA